MIKVDTREKELQKKLNNLILTNSKYKDINISIESLPLGDVIIMHNEIETLIIERKSISDLLSSIKDGRYEEQSFRLNGNIVHNHNIIYLIEGLTKNVKDSQQILWSTIFSLSYYKGFSVIQTSSIDETAFFICNSVVKLINGEKKSRKPFYTNNALNNALPSQMTASTLNNIFDISLNHDIDSSNKEYVGFVKNVKKENITPQNIDEIMLCQIPAISNITAIALINHFGSLSQLIQAFQENPDCWKNITYINEKKQCRKISKLIGSNICKFLLKSEENLTKKNDENTLDDQEKN